MSTMTERDRQLSACWVDVDFTVPAARPSGDHYPVTVWGVINDPRFRINGEVEFMDVVSWWPGLRVWTVTHQSRADGEAFDHPCKVTYWQPLPPLPRS